MRTYSGQELDEIVERHNDAAKLGLMAAAASGFCAGIFFACAAYLLGWIA